MGSVVNRSIDDRALASAGTASRLDAIAWSDLVPVVHRQMRALVGPSRDLEDLTQSALEQVLRSIDRFEGRSELTTFTYRICAHVAMNHWRWWKRWLRRFELGGDHEEHAISPAASTPDAPEAMVHRESSLRLQAALDKLAPQKRIVLVLCDLDELPAPRVAEIVGCGEPTVRSRLRQARIDLAAILSKDPFFAIPSQHGGGEP